MRGRLSAIYVEDKEQEVKCFTTARDYISVFSVFLVKTFLTTLSWLHVKSAESSYVERHYFHPLKFQLCIYTPRLECKESLYLGISIK